MSHRKEPAATPAPLITVDNVDNPASPLSPKALVVWRGPLLISVIVSWVFLPYIVLHWQTSLLVLFVGMGVALGLYDLSIWCRDKLQRSLLRTARTISLDQVLTSLHEAETSAVGMAVATLLGQVAMYGLPCTVEQRTRLFQAGLPGVDEDQARHILLEPGGWQWFLPETVRESIFQTPPRKHLENSTTTTMSELAPPTTPDSDADSNQSQSDESETGEGEMKAEKLLRDFHPRRHKSPNSNSILPQSKTRQRYWSRSEGQNDRSLPPASASASATTTPPRVRAAATTVPPKTTTSSPPLLSVETVFVEVVKEMLASQWKQIGPQVDAWLDPRSLQLTAAITSALFVGHLRWNRRSREMVQNLVAWATTTGLASASAVSITCLVAKYLYQAPPRPPPSRRTSQTSNRNTTMLSQLPKMLQSVLRTVVEKAKDAKWQGVLAALVVFYWGRRRRKSE